MPREETARREGRVGRGDPGHDVGATALATSAFLHAGYTNRGKHAYAKVVSRALRWLRDVQDDEGCFGPRVHPRWVYDHAAAALAMVEAYGETGSPVFRGSAQKALDFVAAARSPGGGWRYGVRPSDADTSVTVWMALPLLAAQSLGEEAAKRGREPPLSVDSGALVAARAWIDSVTDPTTGRTGYRSRGGPVDRPPWAAGFPAERSEATTAAALLVRLLLGERPEESEVVRKGLDLLRARPPRFVPGDGDGDLVYAYFGLRVFSSQGEFTWKGWDGWGEAARALMACQRRDGDPCAFRGSWDPIGPWGPEGGRVVSTALLARALLPRWHVVWGTRDPGRFGR